jgi:hypothetical protein
MKNGENLYFTKKQQRFFLLSDVRKYNDCIHIYHTVMLQFSAIQGPFQKIYLSKKVI